MDRQNAIDLLEYIQKRDDITKDLHDALGMAVIEMRREPWTLGQLIDALEAWPNPRSQVIFNFDIFTVKNIWFHPDRVLINIKEYNNGHDNSRGEPMEVKELLSYLKGKSALPNTRLYIGERPTKTTIIGIAGII